jgi:hypothetical protein
MGGTETDRDAEGQLREAEPRHLENGPPDERTRSERSREPESSEDEESEDNDGGPPSSRRH